MSLRSKLGRLFLFVFLEAGALMGMPITPEQIRQLLDVMTRTRVVHILRTENDEDREDR